MKDPAFQEEAYFQGNHCFGCSPDHPQGLRIKSYWDDNESVCTFQPEPYYSAGWPQVAYGGMIASLIDCHCTCTAIAEANRQLAPGQPAQYWFASVNLKVDFLSPTSLDRPMELRARIVEKHEKKMRVICTVNSGGKETARGEVTAVRVPAAGGPGTQ